MEKENSRRDFLKLGAGLGAAVTLSGTRLMAQEAVENGTALASAKPIDLVRVGFVGVGVKGSEHVSNLLSMEGVELRAVCDIREVQCAETQRQAEQLGKPKPTAYFRGERGEKGPSIKSDQSKSHDGPQKPLRGVTMARAKRGGAARLLGTMDGRFLPPYMGVICQERPVRGSVTFSWGLIGQLDSRQEQRYLFIDCGNHRGLTP